MADVLEQSLVAEVRCSEVEAQALRERVLRWNAQLGAEEDTEEDLIVRLREPAVFGAFAENVAVDPALDLSLRRRVVEHAFDLLPLPRTEGDVILVPGRAPRHLLFLASFLQGAESFTVLQAMHLVYAVFLDRLLFSEVRRSVRFSVVDRLIRDPEIPPPLRVFYAALHLATVGEPEAHNTFERLLRGGDASEEVANELARLSAAPDGGMALLTDLARSESLVYGEADAGPSTAILASVPRLPPRLAALGRRWLAARTSR